jgi:hypothetical protein
MKEVLEQWLDADKNARVKIVEGYNGTGGTFSEFWYFPNVNEVLVIAIGQGGGKGREYGDTTTPTDDGGDTRVYVQKEDGTEALRLHAPGGVRGGDAGMYGGIVYPGRGGGFGELAGGGHGTFEKVYDAALGEPRYFGGQGGVGFMGYGDGFPASASSVNKCGGGGEAGKIDIVKILLDGERANGFVRFRFQFTYNINGGKYGAVIVLW